MYTVDLIEEAFQELANVVCDFFKLDSIPIYVYAECNPDNPLNLGCLHYKYIDGTLEYKGGLIRIFNANNQPLLETVDTLSHELAHYYFAFNQSKDHEENNHFDPHTKMTKKLYSVLKQYYHPMMEAVKETRAASVSMKEAA